VPEGAGGRGPAISRCSACVPCSMKRSGRPRLRTSGRRPAPPAARRPPSPHRPSRRSPRASPAARDRRPARAQASSRGFTNRMFAHRGDEFHAGGQASSSVVPKLSSATRLPRRRTSPRRMASGGAAGRRPRPAGPSAARVAHERRGQGARTPVLEHAPAFVLVRRRHHDQVGHRARIAEIQLPAWVAPSGPTRPRGVPREGHVEVLERDDRGPAGRRRAGGRSSRSPNTGLSPSQAIPAASVTRAARRCLRRSGGRDRSRRTVPGGASHIAGVIATSRASAPPASQTQSPNTRVAGGPAARPELAGARVEGRDAVKGDGLASPLNSRALLRDHVQQPRPLHRFMCSGRRRSRAGSWPSTGPM